MQADTVHSGSTQEFAEVFPHLVTAAADVPTLAKIGDVDWAGIDAAFCCLPHATTQEILKSLPAHIKIVDLSADFRLKDTAVYAEWCAAALPAHVGVHAQGKLLPVLQLWREAEAEPHLHACARQCVCQGVRTLQLWREAEAQPRSHAHDDDGDVSFKQPRRRLEQRQPSLIYLLRRSGMAGSTRRRSCSGRPCMA
jgi:hypothetical protein